MTTEARLRREIYGLLKGSRTIHVAHTYFEDIADSWCGFAMAVWWESPKVMCVKPPFRYCKRCQYLMISGTGISEPMEEFQR